MDCGFFGAILSYYYPCYCYRYFIVNCVLFTVPSVWIYERTSWKTTRGLWTKFSRLLSGTRRCQQTKNHTCRTLQISLSEVSPYAQGVSKTFHSRPVTLSLLTEKGSTHPPETNPLRETRSTIHILHPTQDPYSARLSIWPFDCQIKHSIFRNCGQWTCKDDGNGSFF